MESQWLQWGCSHGGHTAPALELAAAVGQGCVAPIVAPTKPWLQQGVGGGEYGGADGPGKLQGGHVASVAAAGQGCMALAAAPAKPGMLRG